MNKILLSSAVTVLLLAGCSEDKKTDTQATTAEVATQKMVETKETVSNEVKDSVVTLEEKAKEVSNSVVETTTQVIEKAAEEIKENSKDVIESTKEIVEQKVEEVKDSTEEIKNNLKEEVLSATQTVSEKAEEATIAVNEKITEVTSEESTEIVVEGPNGEALYKTCASCHGQKAEKEALGKSQIIAGWDKEKIINAMNGYKNGSYGGVMKNIMKPQVENKTDAEIEALATFISNL